MQPEVNPNYFKYQYPNYMPTYAAPSTSAYPYGNIYQQNVPNVQNMAGKMVNDFNEITANDVPMDGRVAIFPKADMSEIAIKNWESNGTIRTTIFKPVLPSESNNISAEGTKTDYGAFGDVLKGIQNDIKLLNEKVDKIAKPAKAKKEADDE